MTEMASSGQSWDRSLQCHCCRSRAEVQCPLCKVMHCRKCQAGFLKEGMEYIQYGFCPECRSLVSRAIQDLKQSIYWLLQGPGAFKELQASGEYSSWQEYLEHQLLQFSEAVFLLQRNKVPLAEEKLIYDTLDRVKSGLASIPVPDGSSSIELRIRTWTNLYMLWGRISHLMRLGAAYFAGCANIRIDDLLDETENTVKSLFTVMVREGTQDLLTQPIRRTVEECWERLASLYVDLFERKRRRTRTAQNLRAALNHLSEVRIALPLLRDPSKHDIAPEKLLVIHETLRFASYQSISNFRRTGVEFARIEKFLRDVVLISEAGLRNESSSYIPSSIEGAFKIYLESSGEAFRSDLCSIRPDTESDASVLREARAWAWLALCSASLSGHLSIGNEGIGNLWMAYLADLQSRLEEFGGPRETIEEKAFEGLGKLSREAGKPGTLIWDLTVHLRSIWDLKPGTILSRREEGLGIRDTGRFSAQFPWMAQYIDHIQNRLGEPLIQPAQIEKVAPTLPLEQVAPAGPSKFRIHGRWDERTEGIWVVWGLKEDERPSAFGPNDLVVDIGVEPDRLRLFGDAAGWAQIEELSAGGNGNYPSVMGLIMLLDFGKDRPIAIHGGDDSAVKDLNWDPVATVLHDPHCLLIPEMMRDALEDWSKAPGTLREKLPRPSLFVVNRALMSKEGVFQTNGKMKNSK